VPGCIPFNVKRAFGCGTPKARFIFGSKMWIRPLDAHGHVQLVCCTNPSPIGHEEMHMAKRSDFNLSEAIREFRKIDPKANAKKAFEVISKTAPKKPNEGTFKSTFYKLAGAKKRTVRRLKPGRARGGADGGGIIAQATLFISMAGSIAKAKDILTELEAFKEM
jgi:hypothetical protein